MKFDELLGQMVDFYGVDNGRFRLGMAGQLVTFEAVEDENDGYRSMMSEVRLVPDVEAAGIFFATPIASVVVTDATMPTDHESGRHSFDGYALRDATTGHVWLTLGTDNDDDYYPCFTFDYQPSGEKLRIDVA